MLDESPSLAKEPCAQHKLDLAYFTERGRRPLMVRRGALLNYSCISPTGSSNATVSQCWRTTRRCAMHVGSIQPVRTLDRPSRGCYGRCGIPSERTLPFGICWARVLPMRLVTQSSGLDRAILHTLNRTRWGMKRGTTINAANRTSPTYQSLIPACSTRALVLACRGDRRKWPCAASPFARHSPRSRQPPHPR